MSIMVSFESQEHENTKKPNLAGIAAGLGLGYVAYRNRNWIVKEIQSVTSKAQVSLARTTSSKQFRGAIGEMRNLSRSFDEVYDLSPKGIVKSIQAGGRTEQLNKRLSQYNEGLSKRIGRHPLSDLKQSQKIMNNLEGGLASRATRSANSKNLTDILRGKDNRYRKLFGDNLDAAEHIIQHNQRTFFGRTRRPGDHKVDGAKLDMGIAHLISDYETSVTKNLSLSFNDSKDREQFMANLMSVVEEASGRTKTQKEAYQRLGRSGIGNLEGNYYGQELEAYKIAGFQALRENHSPKKRDVFSELLTSSGWQKITMDQARKASVKEHAGKLFMSEPREGLPGIEDVFGSSMRVDITSGPNKKTGVQTKSQTQNFADKYIKQGLDYGLDEKSLASDVFSHQLFVNPKTNEIINISDMKQLGRDIFNSAKDDFQIPFLQFNPLQFLPGQRTASWGRDNFAVLGSEGVQSLVKGLQQLPHADDLRNVGAHANNLAKPYIAYNQKIVDSDIARALTGDSPAERFRQFNDNLSNYALEGEYLLGEGRTGLLKQYAEAVSNRTSRDDLGERNVVQRLLHLGGQEEESYFSKTLRTLKKGSDPYYGENIISTIRGTIELGDDGRGYSEGISRLYGNIYGRTRNLDSDAQNALYPTLNRVLSESLAGEQVDLAKLGDDEYLLDTMEKIASIYKPNRKPILSAEASDVQNQVVGNLEQKIYGIYQYAYKSNQLDYTERVRFLKDRGIDTPGMLYAFFEDDREKLSKTDDLRMLIEQYAIAQADRKGINLHHDIHNTVGVSPRNVEQQLSKYRSLNEIGLYASMAESHDPDQFFGGMQSFANYYQSGSLEELNLKATLAKTDPWYGSGVGKRMDDPLGETPYIAIKKHQGLLQSINQGLVDAGSENGMTWDIAKEGLYNGILDWSKNTNTFFAGRNGNISTATVGPWFMANRLDTTVQKLGLGLPNQDKGSALSIMGWQFGTRIVAPYAAFQYAMYLDGLTGDRISDTAADTYVNMQLDIAGLKEATGINHMGREARRIMPWMEQIDELPINKVFNAASFGAMSEFRSREDLEEYYRSGEDPIRKGRYWGIGSSSMWMGDKIDYYRPNWYRRMKSDYMFTEDIYGSEKEYWANHFMPTPTNPFSTLKHYILDPYHYEDKHAESRPYVLSGGFSELNNIPIMGPAVNRVVSSVLKPERLNPKFNKAHQEYLTSQNEQLVSSYASMNAGGIVELKEGGIRLLSDSYNANFVDEEGELSQEALEEDAVRYASGRHSYAASVSNMVISGSGSIPGGGISSGINPSVGGQPIVGSSAYSQELLSQINQNLVDGRTVNRNDQVSRAGVINPSDFPRLDQLTNPQAFFSTDGVLRDAYYSMGEFGGMYGFLGNTLTGFDQSGRGKTLETSNRFNSLNDQFWDMNLGGLGGDASEIFRRYLPRDPNRDYYNPIRNTQADWMPGQNYFIDFQHGDPYSRVPYGEMRLPGSGYKALYNVRKDAQGNYSAFDRFRVLADVAPYSDEYRAARKEMSLMNQAGLLSEEQQNEYREIRKQISNRMKKKTLYEERFQNAQVERQTLTVDKVIDANTFLTVEMPNNPIKLAGVTIKADDTENQSLVASMIKPGQSLQVDLDMDPLRRVRGDMMNTIRGVVYTPHGVPGSKFGLQGLGKNQNLNYYLSQQENVTAKDDGSATSTVALYSSSQRMLGGITERIVHDIMPTLPVLNVIADKFLRVQSPLESYEREVFSKSWRDWSSPVTGWIQPMFESAASKNPMIASMHGMGIGALAYRRNRWKGAWLGGIAFGMLAGGRTLLDAGSSIFGESNDIWVPKRRRTERDINEYFDRLKYVKYKGLYAQAVEDAERYEGINIDEYYNSLDEAKKGKGSRENYLNTQKKWLTIQKKIGVQNEEEYNLAIADIRTQLNEGDENKQYAQIGPYTALAMRYRDEYESTLYAAGMGETYDYNKIYRALPSKDKQYFTAFQKASPRERKRILQLVPDNQKPIYQRYFGLDVDSPTNMKAYFSDHHLPDEEWDGWEAGNSLDSIKVKVMQQAGIDLTEANFWDDDVAAANASGAEAIPIKKPMFSTMINQGELEKILRGAGLQDVRVQMVSSPSDSTLFSTSMSIQEDRTSELELGMKQYMQYM